jgi:transcriptional antiterminator RfaH
MFTAAWYCARTKPKCEHIAAAHLRFLPGVEAYCPRLRYRKMTRRGPVWFVEALFPGYVFAHFTPSESQRAVAGARAVTSLVQFSGQLASLPDAAIRDLRAHMEDEDCKTMDCEIEEGSEVTITSGVFMGLSTVVTRLMPAGDRVRVLIEILGECREVEVASSHVLPEWTHVLTH